VLSLIPDYASAGLIREVDQVEPLDVSATAGDAFGGGAMARIPDLDGDSLEDLAITVTATGSDTLVRGVFVFSGTTVADDTTPAPILRWEVPAGTADFGTAIVNAGDLDGDGLDDVAIGATDRVFIAFGSNYTVLVPVESPVPAGSGFGASLGRYVGGGVGATGREEGLIIGAPAFSVGTDSGEGAVIWLRASPTLNGAPPPIQTSCLTPGTTAGAAFGASLRGLGPKPGTPTLARVAVGAPGTSNDTGAVVVVDFTIGGGACTTQVGATIAGLTTGERFGAALGQ